MLNEIFFPENLFIYETMWRYMAAEKDKPWIKM